MDVVANAEDHRAAANTAAVFDVYRFFYCRGDTNGVLSPLFLLVGMDSLHYNTTRTNNSCYCCCCYRVDGNRVLLLPATEEEEEVDDDHNKSRCILLLLLLLLLLLPLLLPIVSILRY